MDRRTFNKLAGISALGAITGGVELDAQQPVTGSSEVVLEDEAVLVAFDSGSGALTRFVYKTTQWVIERRPALGVSFRLHAPLATRRDNPVLGVKQRAVSVQKIAPNQVQMVWKNLLSEHGGIIPVTFTATVALVNGTLTFDGSLQNDSQLTIETIDYPYFGDLNPPTRDTRMQTEHMFVGALQGDEIYPHFGNQLGYWGVRFPTKTINGSQTPYCLIQTAQGQPNQTQVDPQGIYIAQHDPQIRYLMQYTSEQHPGTLDWVSNDVPKVDEVSGMPIHLEFRTCHFIFQHPQSTFKLAPVVIRPYSGDWHAGLDIYKQWRATWFSKPVIPQWAREVHSWLQLQVNGAEGDYTIPYKKIAEYGKECADNGVKAIQLVGWNRGGQDGGDPSLDTDPMLGTWQELHDAIAQTQARGVKMIMFGKPIFADMSTDYYKTELYKYDSLDPWGNKYESGGYSYSTPTQLAGINNRRRAIMDVCDQRYKDIATKEFSKTLALNASGWLFDEVMQHNGVHYTFTPDRGYPSPGYLFNADIPMVKQFRAVADKVNPEFLFSGEGPGDWLMPYYPLGYYRIGSGTRHALRYIDPQAPLMAAVRGIDARDEINLNLLYRYIISYEPYNFKGHVTDFPLTLAYGKKVDDFRRKYKAWVWEAEFRDTHGANVKANGNSRYTVYYTPAGKRAVIIANLEAAKSITAHLELPNATGTLMSATPEQPDARPATNQLQIPPRSAIVVMEQ